jgi:CBS domain-containing protein
MKISEIMTVDPVCCSQSETAEAGAVLMQELNIGVIPVVEDDKSYKLVGMVTDRDLCMAVVAEGKDPKSVTLEECMSEMLIFCRPDQEIEDAVLLMQKNQIHRLPVVDSDQRIQGIVSLCDIALYGGLSSEEIEKTIQNISIDDTESDTNLQSYGASYIAPPAVSEPPAR